MKRLNKGLEHTLLGGGEGGGHWRGGAGVEAKESGDDGDSYSLKSLCDPCNPTSLSKSKSNKRERKGKNDYTYNNNRRDVMCNSNTSGTSGEEQGCFLCIGCTN